MSISCIPESAIFEKIFEYLDLQSFGRLGNVAQYFNELRNRILENDPSRYLIPIDSPSWNPCTLNLRERTVFFDAWFDYPSCESVMQYPAVPKGSFLAFPDYQNSRTVAMIKNKEGVTEVVMDEWEKETNQNHAMFIEIRNLQRTESPFHHIKIVIPDPERISRAKEEQNKALVWVLEGKGRDEQDKVEEQNRAIERFLEGKDDLDAAEQTCTLT